jgi:hypothetical protein
LANDFTVGIFSRRNNYFADKETEFLVKPKLKSHLHVEWLTKAGLEEKFSNSKFQLSKFLDNEPEEADIDNVAYYPADYLLVDRIVDIGNACINYGNGKKMINLECW